MSWRKLDGLEHITLGTYKKVWSRIDRSFSNGLWYDTLDYCQVEYMTQGLSHHNPMLLSLPACLRPKTKFMYCDMWAYDPSFTDIITTQLFNLAFDSKLK